MAILEGDSYSQQHIVVRDSNSFDSLRLIFASLVILTHSFALLRLADPLETLSGSRYDLGKVGVTGFFAISGFLVTRSWLNNPNPRRFVLARGLRIFPAFWAALIFSVLLASTLTGFDFLLNGYTWRWLLRNAVLIWKEYGALIPGAFESNPHPGGANGSLWTLTSSISGSPR